jgi:hypothetical protein
LEQVEQVDRPMLEAVTVQTLILGQQLQSEAEAAELGEELAIQTVEPAVQAAVLQELKEFNTHQAVPQLPVKVMPVEMLDLDQVIMLLVQAEVVLLVRRRVELTLAIQPN